MNQHLCIENLDFNLHNCCSFCPRLQHVSFSVSPGEHLVLYHPCGLGSSLILYLITGLIQPDAGHICLDSFTDTDVFHRISLLTIQGLLFSWRAIYQEFPLCRHIPDSTGDMPLMDYRHDCHSAGLFDHTDISSHAASLDCSSSMQSEENLDLIQKLLTTPAGYPSPKQQQLWLRLLEKAASRSVFLLLDRPFRHFDRDCSTHCFDFLHTCTCHCTTILTAATQLSDALLLGNRILFLGGDPTTVCYEYRLPFAPEDTPAMRMRHPDYHRIYQELMEISKSVQTCSGCNQRQSGLY